MVTYLRSYSKKESLLAARGFPIRKKAGSAYPTNQHPNLCKVQNDVLQSARARYPRREYLAFQTPRESKKIPDWNYYPPGKLTWNLNITQLKRKIILQTFIIAFHVNFQGCTPLKLLRSKHATWAEFLRRLFGSPMIGSMMMVLLSWHTRESMNIKVDEQGSLLSLSHSLWNHPQITKEYQRIISRYDNIIPLFQILHSQGGLTNLYICWVHSGKKRVCVCFSYLKSYLRRPKKSIPPNKTFGTLQP